MAVNTEEDYKEYSGTGDASTQNALPFKFLQDDHLNFFVDGVAYVGAVTVVGAGEESGGYVVSEIAIPLGATFRVERNSPFLQPYQYEEGDKLLAEVVEENHDHTVMGLQRLWRNYEGLLGEINSLRSELIGLTSSAFLLEIGTPIETEEGLAILTE